MRNVDVRVVPNDEGNEEGLIFNLVQLLRHGPDAPRYAYLPEQDALVESLLLEHGVSR